MPADSDAVLVIVLLVVCQEMKRHAHEFVFPSLRTQIPRKLPSVFLTKSNSNEITSILRDVHRTDRVELFEPHF